jgi:hypothetical protein
LNKILCFFDSTPKSAEVRGTFPIQSERFYNALKGHGATARFVLLPFESHGYRAKESVLHMLWEMDQWLDKYVKNAKPVNAPGQ